MLASQKKKKEDGEHVLWCLSRVRYCFTIPIDRYWACPLTPFSGRHSGRGTHKDPEFWTGSCRILLMRDSFQIVYFFKLGSMAISNYRNSAWIHWPRNPETLKYNLHIEYGFFFSLTTLSYHRGNHCLDHFCHGKKLTPEEVYLSNARKAAKYCEHSMDDPCVVRVQLWHIWRRGT